MARAGYCSACGAWVYLTVDGACSNGHAAQYISGVYDAPVVQPQPAAPQAASQQAAASYAAPAAAYPAQQAPHAAAQPQSAKKGKGGIVAVVLVGLLLLCVCGAYGGLAAAGIAPNPLDMLASPEHQKVAVAGKFFEAIATANPVVFRGVLPSDAANAADPVFWVSKLAEGGGYGSIVSQTWSGDTLTIVMRSKDGSGETTLVFSSAENDRVKVVSTEGGSSEGGDSSYLQMASEPGGWKVLALLSDDGTEFIRFDAATIKKMEQESK